MRIDKSNIRFTISTLVGWKNATNFSKWAFGRMNVDNHSTDEIFRLWNGRHKPLFHARKGDIFALNKMANIWRNIKGN